MKIEKLFDRDIHRPINGVVKADQLDESTVWQELDEFVVTRELDQHFRKFMGAYLDSIDHPNDPDVAGKIGVWVSGFFGSGKSHFIKMLSYLLANNEHTHNGVTKRGVNFFESKVEDAMLFGDIKRAVASNTDVILFNIDSKADTRAGRDAILVVFLKVLNEMQGYSPDHSHIAHMERYLDGKGKLPTFHEEFKKATGTSWPAERDAYEFNRDEVVDALSNTLGQSKESCEKWIDKADENFSLTIENFCKWVKQYLDSKGPDHRIIFLVDEVGQFIGNDTHLMLNLQTITEDLGTLCGGRAWVVVTSQEDIDAVLGELRTTKAQDFSKIQGRFKTRLSLSSANVDEVIQERLLAKVDEEEVTNWLSSTYQEKGDILKNQLTFSKVGMTFRQYKDTDDFACNYPFAPYQFQLVQKIFEAIRKAGATGLHLSRGERSILDAFQSAGKQVADCEVGVLVPMYRFYPSIESFLDTSVKRTIDQAKDNTSLEPFDIEVLRVLFLIRYVDEIKGNVDNLVTLCTDQIDADRLALRRQIEDSLQRLEKETLINRSGDNYFFLTNEERDINREIKTVEISSGEEAKLLGEVIFDDVLKGARKHRYTANKMDFTFNRICDGFPYGTRSDGALVVSTFSPLSESDPELFEDGRFLRDSNDEGGQVIIKLDDNPDLGRELRQHIQTEKYIRTKSDTTLPDTTKTILKNLNTDNQERRERLRNLLGDLVADATYFAAGERLDIKASAPQAAVDEALEYLIANTFTKMSFIKRINDQPKKELQAILRANDIQQQTLALTMEEGNAQAIADLRGYIDLCTKASRPIVLHELIESRYAQRPYGWPADEVLVLTARLLVLGEIQLVTAGATIPIDKIYDQVSSTRKWRSISVVRRKTTDPKVLQQARGQCKEVFSEMGPDSEDALHTFIQQRIKSWENSLNQYKPLAETGKYPGHSEITDALGVIRKLLGCDESARCIEQFLERKDDLEELSDSFRDLEHFYEHQRSTWERLRGACDRFNLNQMELERDEVAGPALRRMKEILSAPSPYGIIKEADALIANVEGVNDSLIAAGRKAALEKVDALIEQVKEEAATVSGGAGLEKTCLTPLETLRSQVDLQDSLAHMTQAEQEAERALDAALRKVEEFAAKPTPTGGDKGDQPKPVVKPRHVVKPADHVKTTYLETQDDIDGFLNALRKELEEAISKGERIQIR